MNLKRYFAKQDSPFFKMGEEIKNRYDISRFLHWLTGDEFCDPPPEWYPEYIGIIKEEMKMKYKEYHNLVDRGGWGQGPWDSEPDKIQYIDEETGLPCIIRRNDMGALCGYVGVSKGHPYYGKHWDEVNPKVHGGITFTNKCSGDEQGICHTVEHQEDDDVWWLGFDCAHAGDYAPGSSFSHHKFNEYRDINYVKDQISFLAKQLKNYKEVFGEA